MTTLYKISNDKLEKVKRTSLPSESVLEGWVADNPALVGLDVLVIGTQVVQNLVGGLIFLL